MRILVDQDGVLTNFERKFLDVWRNMYPGRPYIKQNERKTFYPEDEYPQEYKGDIEAIVNSPDFFRDLPPIDGAIEGIKYLQGKYGDVFICTSPKTSNSACYQNKFDWVRKYLGESWTKRLIITKDKTIVTGDYLIDDKPVITGAQNPPKWEQIVYDQPYNKQIEKQRATWDTIETIL